MPVALEVALISGGITLIGLVFNLAAGRANRRATNDNAMATLDAAHDAQLWQKRADAYVDTMVFLQAAHAARQRFLGEPPGPLPPKQMKRLANLYLEGDWSLIEGRMSAYATDSVLMALAAMHEAWDVVMDAYKQDQQTEPQEEQQAEPQAASDAVKVALEEADRKENAVRVAMQTDLAAKPSMLQVRARNTKARRR